METKFIPDPDTLCYVTAIPETRTVVNGDGVATKVKEANKSFQGYIFRTLGHDMMMMVAQPVFSNYYLSEDEKKRKHIFRINDWKFEPVGPDVAKALGLTM